MCECKQPIKVDIKLHSEYVTMERNGDLIDLNYCGLDKVFVGNLEHIKTRKEFKICETIGGKCLGEVREVDAIEYKKGDIFRVKLGFSMKMPNGKMAKVPPRSGTRKNFGVILTNSVGQIDNEFQGSEDEWNAEFYAIQDGTMAMGDRILQFEIADVMPKVEFNVVEDLQGKNRGGYSSTGK